MNKETNQGQFKQKVAQGKAVLMAGALALSMAATSAHAYTETLIFWGGTSQSGGSVTFTDEGVGPNQLKITIDNTSNFSGIITGIIFNITEDILGASIASFTDGLNNPITGWTVGVDVNNETTPGNTQFDIGFETTSGINNGIYNSGAGGDTTNAVPDIATLILNITDPNPWSFTNIIDLEEATALALTSSDTKDSFEDYAATLRTQRTGINENGSDKIVTSSSSTSGSTTSGSTTSSTTSGSTTSSTGGTEISEPGILALLGIGLLGQAFLLISRRRRLGM